VDLSALTELHDWMRARGVRRVRTPEVEVELGDAPLAEPAPRRKLSAEEQQAAAKEKKRQRYELELGHRVSDELLERLP